MAWVTGFYQRRKNPWLGFIFVLLFGPFGFLYHSWKTALVVFFVTVPLWIMFLRGTAIDLVENPWARYTALVLLAIFAWLQVIGLGKATVTPSQLAEKLFKITVKELEQDRMFLEQVREAGLDVEIFPTEFLCLKVFATTAAFGAAAIRDRKFSPAVCDEFMECWRSQINEYSDGLGLEGVLQTEDGVMSMAQFIFDRMDYYAQLCSEDNPMQRPDAIASGFSRLCCGKDTNSTLTRIGHSVYLFRGNEIARCLDLFKVKSVPKR